MAGLVPAIHAVGLGKALQDRAAFTLKTLQRKRRPDRVDDRDKPGHDGGGRVELSRHETLRQRKLAGSGNFTMVRNGTCSKCETCRGGTTGYS